MPLGEWQAEHTRLFVSGHPRTVCPPYESAYRKGDSGGLAAEKLTALYRQIGLETKDISADYLGAILECAAYLLETPQTQDEETWSRLWEGHIVGWVPAFANDLHTETRMLLYHRLARQLLESIADGR